MKSVVIPLIQVSLQPAGCENQSECLFGYLLHAVNGTITLAVILGTMTHGVKDWR